MVLRPRLPPPLSPSSPPSAEHYRFFLDEAWDALGQYGLADDDRDDLAQRVLIAAFSRWQTYRAVAGSLRQWIRGIARNEVLHFRRTQRGKAGGADAGRVVDPATEGVTIETRAATRDLLDHLLAQVPIQQRRVVILVELFGLTFREAAKEERTSTTRAHARHVAGMAALHEAGERWRREQESRGAVPLPVVLDDLFARYQPPEAPDEVHERARRSLAAELGEPGARSSRLVLVGLAGGSLVASMIAGAALGRCSPGQPSAAPVEAVVSAERRADAPSAGPVASVTSAAPALAPPTGAPPAVSPPAVARPAGGPPGGNEQLRVEQAMLDEARSAILSRHPDAAIAKLAEHARRFPRGPIAEERQRLWDVACAATATARCGRRP